MMHALSARSSTTTLGLDEWLAQQPETSFPLHGGLPYPGRFTNVAGYLNANVHPHVEKGALAQGDGYLNDHGPEHIKTVIQRATALLSHPEDMYPQLHAYEVYLLLMAIHFHDIGNLYGRKGHEEKLAPIMQELGKLAGTEMVEKKAIKQIARSHGGRINGDKDTIRHLREKDPLLGKDVRYQALAAIVRFADELADDVHRAARVMVELGVIPAKSEVFHAYSQSLKSVQVKPAERLIDLRYSFLKADGTRKFGKLRRKVYLLDEVFERTLKMHFERQYCMRFMRDIVRIDAIDVRIEVYADENSMTPCVDAIGYRLEEKGYPAPDSIKIYDICPDVTCDGQRLDKMLR